MWLARLVVAALGLRLLLFAAAAARAPSDGFVAYYTAARLLREGQPVSRFYDNDWFRAQVNRINPAVSDIYNVNPPTTVLLMLPLAWLDHDTARVGWVSLSIIILGASLAFVMRQLHLSGVAGLLFLGLVFVYQPLFANLKHGQAYIFLLGLLALAWYGHRRGRPTLFGSALGSLLILKTAGAMLWLLPAIGRKWRVVVVGLGVVLGVALASLPWIGLEAWRTYLPLLAGLTARPETAVPAYQTVMSFFRHLFTYDPQWNPAPLWLAPVLGQALPWLVIVVMLAASGYTVLRGAEADLAFALFAIASVVLTPVSLDYHYTLLLMPIAILIAWAGRQASAWPWIVLAAGAALIAADLPYNSPRVAVGALALLAYPKLYGAGLLWALAWWASRRSWRPAAAPPAAAGAQ